MIRKELAALVDERQWIITQARKSRITSRDMEQQLGSVSMLEIELKRELSTIGHAISIELLDGWEVKIKGYLQDLQAGIDALNDTVPQNDEELREIFELKKKLSILSLRK